MELTKKQLKELEEKLRSIKNEIEKMLESLKKSLNFGNDVDGFDEETDEAEEYANFVGIEKMLKERVIRIDDLLEQMESGTYEVCKECKTKKGYEFLKENPDSYFCLHCKAEK